MGAIPPYFLRKILFLNFPVSKAPEKLTAQGQDKNLTDSFLTENGLCLFNQQASDSLAFYTSKLAEIRSLAVFNRYKMKGIGRLLVEKAETVLREEGVSEVFVLTLSSEFFRRLGYREIQKEYFPQKIWRDCTHCPKLMACDEIAMVKTL